jgi:hypothetical protein
MDENSKRRFDAIVELYKQGSVSLNGVRTNGGQLSPCGPQLQH